MFTVRTVLLTIVTLALGLATSAARAEVYVSDVPSPIKAKDARKSGKTIYKCTKMKLSGKTGDPKKVAGSKVLFTVSALKGLDKVDERFDNGERLYKCEAREVSEETGKLIKGEQDDE